MGGRDTMVAHPLDILGVPPSSHYHYVRPMIMMYGISLILCISPTALRSDFLIDYVTLFWCISPLLAVAMMVTQSRW
jgi:hypothetical protein